MSLDVTSLYNRRADQRWNRVCTADLIERVTWSTPEHDAIIGLDGATSSDRYARLTYREADELANRVAHALLGAGLDRGGRIAMFVENSVEAYVFRLGAAKIGTVVAPINPALRSDVIAHTLGVLDPGFIAVDAELFERVSPGLDEAGLKAHMTFEIGGSAVAGTVSFDDFVEGQPDREPSGTVHGDDIAEILFTSGTTAMPKGVMLSHTSATLAAHGFALSLTRGLKFESDLVLVTCLPMMYHIGHHIFALATMAVGGTFVMGRRPDPAVIAEALSAEQATALWGGSPAMVDALTSELEEQDISLPHLTTVTYGWAALPPSVLDRLRARAPQVHPFAIFGQTESISCHRFWPDGDDELYRRTSPTENYVGYPSPLLASRIVDPLGEPIDENTDTVGEAVYRSPVMVAGYYKNENATREAFRGGWFSSGDSCRYGEGGRRIMVDRLKDIVKSGGENVSSLRVESVLVQHPAVTQAAVVGLPDERWGEAVTAVIVPRGQAPDPAEIIAYAREHLAGFETPKHVIYRDELPSTVGGKILKYKLRQGLTIESPAPDA
ncbi:AMP-binding protein [Brevibacterium atlanticum]|uniref:AMP-binding protein n=1 Tax=Brevibacterium atlanticum TaxID=2697563 RepID=UPI00141D8B3F|nr:AMP-binding protein [Brevibacterium atlanticum]